MFVGIFSCVSSKDRRNVIRITWLKYCERSLKCAYKFLLDRNIQFGDPCTENITNLSLEESKSNSNDTVLLKSFVGINFGQRMYQLIYWLHKNYDFEYFLGLDDDHYVCLNKNMYELKGKDQKNLYWGKQVCGESEFLILIYLLDTGCKFRNSHPKVFLEKGVLKIYSKFTGEHPCRSVVSIKLVCNFSTLLKSHFRTGVLL